MPTYDEALATFLKLLQVRENDHIAKDFPTLKPATFSVMPGRVYDKIVRTTNQRCSFCYVKKDTGGIYKGSWKAVENPKVERGNIFAVDPLKGTNVYGADCLR